METYIFSEWLIKDAHKMHKHNIAMATCMGMVYVQIWKSWKKTEKEVSGNSVSCSTVKSSEIMELCTVVNIPTVTLFGKTRKNIPVLTKLARVAVETSPPLNFFSTITHDTVSPAC